MVTVYYTFGYGHVDPITGQRLADTYAKVTAGSAEETWALMVSLYGNQWAFDYQAEAFERMLAEHPLRQHIEITLAGRG